jgi:hypothetical protein
VTQRVVFLETAVISRLDGECWIERNAAALIARAKASRWSREIFNDARWFRDRDGYAPDVALAISCRYWLS